MNEFEKAKEVYEQIPIPEELEERVQAGIRQGREARRSAKRGAELETVRRRGSCVLCGDGGHAERIAYGGGGRCGCARCWEDCSRC